jgi:hypothetical protein
MRWISFAIAATTSYRRNFQLQAKFESGSSWFSVNR